MTHSVQDRDGAALLFDRITVRFSFVERFFADAGYQGPRVAEFAPRPVEIVKRTELGFVVQLRKILDLLERMHDLNEDALSKPEC